MLSAASARKLNKSLNTFILEKSLDRIEAKIISSAEQNFSTRYELTKHEKLNRSILITTLREAGYAVRYANIISPVLLIRWDNFKEY